MIALFTTLLLSNVSVSIPAEVQVRGVEMRLGEIASVEGDDPAQVAAVRSVELGYAPSPGYERVLLGWQVQAAIRNAGVDARVELLGSDSCVVRPETATVPQAEIAAEARRALEELFEGQDAVISAGGAGSDLRIPAGLREHALTAVLPRNEARGGQWSVPVRVTVDGELYTTVWSTFQVELYRRLPVLTRDVAPGETLDAGMVALKRVPVEGHVSGRPLSGLEVAGSVAARGLAAGAVLTDRDVRRAVLVRRGEPAQLEVRKGAIVARANVIARQDGHRGDVVQVISAESGRELHARVIGKGLLSIVLGDE